MAKGLKVVSASPGSWRSCGACTGVLDRCLTEVKPSLVEEQCQEQVIMPEAFTDRLKDRGMIGQLNRALLCGCDFFKALRMLACIRN